MEEKVLSYCREQKLFCPGERVTVAVSGGADSMALLTVLLALRERLGIDLAAAHFHHGLRGEEADRDEAFVTDWCSAKGIPLTVGHGDVPRRVQETGESIEEAARALRYGFFDTLDGDKLATAHTADDNAETLLLHLLRGTGPRGLCGIPPVRGKLVRPLLTVSRQEIEVYLSQKGVGYVEDSTNSKDDCVRNRIRHWVMPELKKENPSFLRTVARTTELQRQEDGFLSSLAAAAETDCRCKTGYDCRKLRQLHPVLRRRVLLSLLERLELENPAAVYVAALERLIFSQNPSGRLCLPGSIVLCRQYDLLRLAPEAPVNTFTPVPLAVPGDTLLPELGLRIRCFVTKNSEFGQNKLNIFFLKYDMISHALTVRPRKTGDSLRLPGGTKTLKRLMIDRKIPASRRNALPVIDCEGKPIAVWQVGADVSATAAKGAPALAVLFEPMES